MQDGAHMKAWASAATAAMCIAVWLAHGETMHESTTGKIDPSLLLMTTPQMEMLHL